MQHWSWLSYGLCGGKLQCEKLWGRGGCCEECWHANRTRWQRWWLVGTIFFTNITNALRACRWLGMCHLSSCYL
jgi:hypothetical protein